jgi:hypothetical protein
MRAIIAGMIGAVITSLLQIILLRTVGLTARQHVNRYILEYGTGMRCLGIAMLLLGGLLIYGAAHASANQHLAALLVSGSGVIGILCLFLEVFLSASSSTSLSFIHFLPGGAGDRFRGQKSYPMIIPA